MILVAENHAAVGQRFLVSGEPVTWAQFYEALAKAAGARPPKYIPTETIIRENNRVRKLLRLGASPWLLARRAARLEVIKKVLRKGPNIYFDYEGFVSEFVRWGGNAPGKILNSVAVAFDTDVVSEHEPQFWGFDTQEEWDARMETISREIEEESRVELLKFLRGEHNDIQPGTVGMIEAEIAKVLVEKDPSLILPENRERLRSEIQLIYDRDHAVTVTLSPQDIEFAKMLVTHEDNLPKA